MHKIKSLTIFPLRNLYSDNKSLLAFLLLLTVIITPSFFFGGREDIGDAVAWSLSLPLVFFVFRSKNYSPQNPLLWNILMTSLLAYVLLISLSTIYSVNLYETIKGAVDFIFVFLIFWAGGSLVKTEKQLKAAAYVVLGWVFILSVIGLILFYFSEQFEYLRLGSTFKDHQGFGAFLLFALPISILLFFESTKKSRYLIFGFITLIISTAFVFTHSRATWISFAVPLLVTVWLISRKISKTKIIAGLVLLALIISSSFGIAFLKKHQAEVVNKITTYSSETRDENAVVARLHYFKAAWDIFTENKLFGTGYNTYKVMHRQIIKDVRFFTADPHSYPLKALSELGIIGFAAFSVIILIILYSVFKNIVQYYKEGGNYLTAGLGLGLLGNIFYISINPAWFFPSNIVLFFLIASIVSFHTKIEKPNPFKKLKRYYSASKKIYALIALWLVGILLTSFALPLFFGSQNYILAKNARNNPKFSIEEIQKKYQRALNWNKINPKYKIGYAETLVKQMSLNRKNGLPYRQILTELLDTAASAEVWMSKSYEIHQTLADGYMILNEPESAIRELNTAIDNYPAAEPKIYMKLGLVYKKIGRCDLAIKEMEKTLPYYPISVFDSIIWVNPNRIRFKKNISTIYAIIGDCADNINKKKESYLKAIEYNSKNIYPYVKLMEINDQLSIFPEICGYIEERPKDNNAPEIIKEIVDKCDKSNSAAN